MCTAVESEEVTHCADAVPVPTALTGAEPQPGIEVPLSLKFAVPVGDPLAGAGEPEPENTIEAVKVTDWPVFVELDGEAPVIVLVVLNRSTFVTVGSVAPPGVGSSVSSGLPVNDPDNVPWFETVGVAGGTPDKLGGLFSVTLKVIVVVLPVGSVKPLLLRPLTGNVPPENIGTNGAR